MISCDALKAALKAARTPMQDCIVLIDEAGSVTLEAESFVAACAVGIRFRGAVSAHEAERRLKFSAVEFFEPTEEWGISRGLAKCEEALRPLAPSAGGGHGVAGGIAAIPRPQVVRRRHAIAQENLRDAGASS